MELGAKFSKLEGGEVVDSNTYRSMIGSLRYLTCTSPDIAFTMRVASRFMEDPIYPHLKAVKRILRYVKGTEDLRLFYERLMFFNLQVMWTVTDAVTLMIARAPRDMHST
jgi:hypothetical protein